MSMNYNHLIGPQRKVLRKAILEAFGYDMDALAVVMRDMHGLKALGYYAAASHDADVRLGLAIDKMQRLYVLQHLVAAVKSSDYGANPELQNLDDRLMMASPEIPEEVSSEAAVLAFERGMAGFADAELFLWTERLLEIGAAMAQASYPARAGAGPVTINGTGIALGHGTILTNQHVIQPILNGQAGAGDVKLTFNLALRSSGALPVTTLQLTEEGWQGPSRPPSAADLTEDGLAAPEELDYAVLHVTGQGGPSARIDLSQAAPPPAAGAVLLILHHPEGLPLKLSLGVSLGLHGPNRLRYKARTVGGSSGGLVLDAQLNPVALHHASDPDRQRDATYNQGVPLALIAADIATRGQG
ncbi:trypsin-like serine peptidase [Mesobacterium pallidum]|uniref:trypsin-like serine peptidase n=1 Tax=Mesobacterium pallidum TaxID=2872037 RepID=UPI001EE178FB|nr:serine protease [Mesobacterium pallidum]